MFALRVAAPLVPVTVRLVIRLVYAVSQFDWEVVVGIAYPAVNVKANVPEEVTGEPLTDNPVGTVIETEVTVPVVEDVPAPMAVLKVAASKAETVLSKLNLGNVTADGLVRVNRLPPTVVAPKLVLPVAATKLVDPPSHCLLSENAESQLVWEAVVGME